MSLSRKGDAAPDQMPGRDRDLTGDWWDDLENNELGRYFCDWGEIIDEPEYNASTHHLEWDGIAMVAVENPPPPPSVIRMSLIDFMRLFTTTEEVSWQYRKRVLDHMTPEEFLASTPMQAFAVINGRFDKLKDTIEITHPETIAAVTDVLAPLLPLDEDRVARILSGQLPA